MNRTLFCLSAAVWLITRRHPFTVQLPGGGLLKARGSAEVGQNVFVRDGLVEAVAPNLTLEIIEV